MVVVVVVVVVLHGRLGLMGLIVVHSDWEVKPETSQNGLEIGL